jgi:hypothetical protein
MERQTGSNRIRGTHPQARKALETGLEEINGDLREEDF